MNCNDIEREALELQMKFQNCTVAKAEDLKKLAELLLKINECKQNKEDALIGVEIFSFQFETINETVNDINLIDDLFLSKNGLYHSENDILFGKNIEFKNIGRFGFVIKNKQINPYFIFDLLNLNISTLTFDYVYDAGISYFVSKDYIVPSFNYFKFINNNI